MNHNDNTQEKISRVILQTPHGSMEAMASQRGLCVLEFYKPHRQNLVHHRLDKWFHPYQIEEVSLTGESNHILQSTALWLENYFARRFHLLKTPLLDLRGSDFELKVWQALLSIPLGEIRSYGEIAAQVDQPKASRAVGNANRRNPVAIIVPCHRVIGSDRRLVGYGGGLPMKQILLDLERGEKTLKQSSFVF